MNRVVQFDILRGIGILCVLLGHSVITGAPKEIVYGFHMPLFFFCSGVFFKDKCIKDTVLSCVKKLLIPYIFFIFVLGASYFLVNVIGGDTLNAAISNSVGRFDFFDEHSKAYLSIWFLICLFFVKILFALLYKISDKVWFHLLIGTFGYLIGSSIELPLFIDTALCVYIYYTLGYYFFSTGLYKKRMDKYVVILLITLYMVAIFVLHPSVDIKDKLYPIYHILLVIPSIFALYHLCYMLTLKSANGGGYINVITKFFIKCGRSSLSLLGLHRPLWLFVYPICLKLNMPDLIFAATEIITAAAIILPMHKLISKYVPFLIGQK